MDIEIISRANATSRTEARVWPFNWLDLDDKRVEE